MALLRQAMQSRANPQQQARPRQPVQRATPDIPAGTPTRSNTTPGLPLPPGPAGTQKTGNYDIPIIVDRSMNQVKNIEDMIVYHDPSGNNVRLKDVAKVKREFTQPTEVITNNGHKCLLLSVEIKSGRNITDMGNAVKGKIAAFKKTLPQDVNIFTITDQSKVVSDSVVDFLKELLIAIAAVVGVVMLLLPMRVALVSASTIPISIFISLGLFYAFGIELNTVTLAALIVTLGMIVDNSIVIIDNYMELLSQGKSRWHASITSATHFFKSILSATLAISVTFFPFQSGQ
jgi:multidrug efflux pump subunit AcrB